MRERKRTAQSGQRKAEADQALRFALCALSFTFLFMSPAQAAPQCSDGIDNDMDGLVDYPNDPGCASANATEEFNAPAPPAPVNGLVAGGLLWYPATTLGPNLLANPGFEDGVDINGIPVGWDPPGGNTWGDPGWAVDSTVAHSGTNSLRLKNANLTPYADFYGQTLSLKKGSYHISGWIKLDGLAASQGSSGRGVRLQLAPPWGQPGGGDSSAEIKGTSDWQYLEKKNVVITQDINNAEFQLVSLGDPDGTAWLDDAEVREELPPPVDAFMLYPNYRGYLFEDQSPHMRFDVSVHPPSGTSFADWKVQISLTDEADNSQGIPQTYTATGNFTADLSGSGLVHGHTYLARFKLLRNSDNLPIYEYPPYRISKISGSARSSMAMSFDENNRILFNGQPKFLLGVYDSGLGYSEGESYWEDTLFSATGLRRMGGLPINFYNNYWLGGASVASMQAMSNVMQRHGIYFIHTGNCFSDYFNPPDFRIHTEDSYVSGLSAISGMAGFYIMDECVNELAPQVFSTTQRLNSLKPDGINFGAGNSSGMSYWCDTADLLSMDPYPMYGAEPAGGYNFSMVSDWTKAAKESVKSARPIATVIQFFKFTSLSRWPTQNELRNMSYMAIAEGSNGLVYWSIGVNALAWICDGSDASHSPSGGDSWCQAKVDNFNNLKAVVTEIASLQPVLSSIDSPNLLVSNSNASIHTRVKFANGKGYLIASNNSNANASATFTWRQPPAQVNVYGEGRAVSIAGATFTDSFAPYQAHVYEIQAGPAVTLVQADLASVKVYPNPWRKDKHGAHPVTFDGLTVGTTVKIFTVSGHEVKGIRTDGPKVDWDLTNDSGEKIASGIYMYLITDGQGNKAKGKVAVIK